MTGSVRDGRTNDDLHFVATEAAFRDSSRILVEIQGIEIAVFNVGGEYFALSNFCVHQGGPICEGTVGGALETDENFELRYGREGRVVSCPWHGWEFDITTGRPLAPTGYRQPVYEVVVSDGDVFVRL